MVAATSHETRSITHRGVTVRPPVRWFERRRNLIAAWVAAIVFAPVLYVFGALWLSVSILIFLRGASNVANYGGGMVMSRFASRLFRAARHLWPRRVTFVADRPTVLFLRAFFEDGRRIERPIRAWDSAELTSLEELVTTVVGEHANVVAIADPRAWFQPLGPDFVKCDADWRYEVSAWMKAASRVVVLVNTTDGVSWELTAALEPEHVSKAIFLFSSLSSYWGSRDEEGMKARRKAFDKAARDAGWAVEDPDAAVPGAFLLGISFVGGALRCHRVNVEEKYSKLPGISDYKEWLHMLLSSDALTSGPAQLPSHAPG